MFPRVLVPLILLLIVLPIVVHGTPLKHFGGSWRREGLGVLVCVVLYFAVWAGLSALIRVVAGSDMLALVLSSLLALVSLPFSLWLGFKVSGVRPLAPVNEEAH